MLKREKKSIIEESFGIMPDGKEAKLYTLTNSKGASVSLTNYGAAVVSILVPDRKGNFKDIALGFNSVDGYLSEDNPFFGSTIGRYANRIARGRFSLNGKTYTLAINNGVNHLHGGLKGFDKILWTTEKFTLDSNKISFSYLSVDGEEGYPGNLEVIVTFEWTDDNKLKIDYKASSDADTIVNLTNHTYFNLEGNGSIVDHILQINANFYTPVDETQIPTGEIISVKNTPFDFTTPTRIGDRIDDFSNEQMRYGGGYDHNFVLNSNGSLSHVAMVYSSKSGIKLDVFTTEPGMQFYSGNNINCKREGKNGIVYKKRDGFCLETQHFPDSPNKPHFPSVVLRKGAIFKSTTIYSFSIE
ncbi:MAG: galactose mutarotase [Chitinispirillaceae bacterium]|nr:galactose mutarotase [Chitinispirillaceae bacterium]